MYGAEIGFGLTLNVNDRAISFDMTDTALKNIQLHSFNVNFYGLDGLAKFKTVQRSDPDSAIPYGNTLRSKILRGNFGKVPLSFHFAQRNRPDADSVA